MTGAGGRFQSPQRGNGGGGSGGEGGTGAGNGIEGMGSGGEGGTGGRGGEGSGGDGGGSGNGGGSGRGSGGGEGSGGEGSGGEGGTGGQAMGMGGGGAEEGRRQSGGQSVRREGNAMGGDGGDGGERGRDGGERNRVCGTVPITATAAAGANACGEAQGGLEGMRERGRGSASGATEALNVAARDLRGEGSGGEADGAEGSVGREDGGAACAGGVGDVGDVGGAAGVVGRKRGREEEAEGGDMAAMDGREGGGKSSKRREWLSEGIGAAREAQRIQAQQQQQGQAEEQEEEEGREGADVHMREGFEEMGQEEDGEETEDEKEGEDGGEERGEGGREEAGQEEGAAGLLSLSASLAAPATTPFHAPPAIAPTAAAAVAVEGRGGEVAEGGDGGGAEAVRGAEGVEGAYSAQGARGGEGAGSAEGAEGSGGVMSRQAAREAALNKFRLKRKERNFEKKVRYQSRKRLAEQRPRFRGQFVRQPALPPTPPPPTAAPPPTSLTPPPAHPTALQPRLPLPPGTAPSVHAERGQGSTPFPVHLPVMHAQGVAGVAGMTGVHVPGMVAAAPAPAPAASNLDRTMQFFPIAPCPAVATAPSIAAAPPSGPLPLALSSRGQERVFMSHSNGISIGSFAAMVLEATVVCVDNSEWMRNGDYAPSRFQAQADAINLICGAKTQSNPENTVGILTMAGKGVRVLVTPTADLGKILSTMHGLEVGGDTNLLSGLQVAQLALKHRQNKNQRQRIVLFIGSPVAADIETLVKAGKRLKKNNVALDVVSFGWDGEDEDKQAKLEALLGAVNSNDNSHLLHVPPGPAVLSDVLISSPVFTGDGEGGSGFAAAAAAGAAAAVAAGGGGLGGDFDFGVDPSVDPELALALRVSMEEERARQEAAARKAAAEQQAAAGGGGEGGSGGEGGEGGKGDVAMGEGEKKEEEGRATAAPAAADVAMVSGGVMGCGLVLGSIYRSAPPTYLSLPCSFALFFLLSFSLSPHTHQDDEAALLQQALAMSMAAGAAGGAGDAAMLDATAGGEDAELALALQLSMQEAAEEGKKEAAAAAAGASGEAPAAAAAAAPGDVDMSQVLGDASFVNSILSSLPGVDPNDPSVRDVLASLAPSQPPKDTEEKPKEDK
ncbi:unnamed protein product [Closterium sp. Yama58-4]|nr:unnamed protein product [Closterium sp. Yama58-4]